MKPLWPGIAKMLKDGYDKKNGLMTARSKHNSITFETPVVCGGKND